MTAAVVMSRTWRRRPDLGLPVLEPGDPAAAAHDRLLVLGPTAAVAETAAAAPGAALAFCGAAELHALFALDGSLESARRRLHGGSGYRADLGSLVVGGKEHPFLAWASAAASRHGFPWRGRGGPVEVTGGRRSLGADQARAVVVANAKHRRRQQVAPRAALDDGLLDAVMFSGGRLTLARLRPALRLGLHERSPAVHRTLLDGGRVAVPGAWPVLADGRAVGRGSFTVALRRGAVTLLV